MNAAWRSIVVAALALAAAGCTANQLYFTGQSWQRNTCNQIAENGERERCLGQTETPYETYARQAADAKQQ